MRTNDTAGTAALALILATFSNGAVAELQPRNLDGDTATVEAVYDTDRDITWLTNPTERLAGSVFDDSANDTDAERNDGLVSWRNAVDWADSLIVGGAADWRLPATADPDGTCFGGSSTVTADGFGCTGGEMGHLYYDELDVTAGDPITSSNDPAIDYFSGLLLRENWSGTVYSQNADYAWTFNLGTGYQIPISKTTTRYQPAMAVRDGDIADIPEGPEICDNGIDDDRDGLIDGDDADCTTTRIGLRVRCLHQPLYPQPGDEVTIRATAFDQQALPVTVDEIDIYFNGQSGPYSSATGSVDSHEAVGQATDGEITYSCMATLGDETAFSRVITVDVGTPELDPHRYPAVPVIYRGRPSEKIDIVFFPDRDTYPGGPSDSAFLDDLHLMIRKGLLEVSWYLAFQDYVNVWIGMDSAGISPRLPDDPDNPRNKCRHDKPDRFKRRYGFADSVGIIHDQDCRDRAGPLTFSTRVNLTSLQTLAHELGHSAFSLPDEYEDDGGYYPLEVQSSLFLTAPFPLRSDAFCRRAARDRGYDPDACRQLDAAGLRLDMWLFEPDYSLGEPREPDVMQSTGCVAPRRDWNDCLFREAERTGAAQDPTGLVACDRRLEIYRGDPDGIAQNDNDRWWRCIEPGGPADAVWEPWADRGAEEKLDIGDSERGRAIWKLTRCLKGRC